MSGSRFHYETATRSHVGCKRSLNEDACLARPDLGLWVVADGMGGHDAGDVASQAIVSALSEIEMPDTAGGFLADVQNQLHGVHAQLRASAMEQDIAAIGSTVVVLMVFNGHFACAWAGDSRLYLWREGQLTQISHDHSYVQELVDLGLVKPEEARTHPRGNVITRAVGAGDDLQLEVRQSRLNPEDQFLLCSDGLNRMVEDDEIAAALEAGSVEGTASSLLDLALTRGAKDNVTLITVRCSEAG